MGAKPCVVEVAFDFIPMASQQARKGEGVVRVLFEKSRDQDGAVERVLYGSEIEECGNGSTSRSRTAPGTR